MNTNETDTGEHHNPFDLRRIVAETFVEDVDYYPTVDSTNNVGLEHCRREDDHGPLLVLTSQQTHGRGRGKNSWWSADGALTFSLVFRPEQFRLNRDRWPQASLTAGLSVCLAVDALLPDVRPKLKWPNDIYLTGRKLCGILVEVSPTAKPKLVLGIGVNVNNGFAEAPPELSTIATSLADVSGRQFDRTDVLVGLLQQLETQLRRLADDDPELPADWQQRCLLRGLTVTIDTQATCTTGRCAGIDHDGALVLETDHGPKRFFGGVVSRFV